jgi:UDP:flavonoid glycosyltransferase YjiC (YdhE family)
VKSVLEEPGYRARARGLEREIKALPGLAQAVKRLETLAETRAPQLDVGGVDHIWPGKAGTK